MLLTIDRVSPPSGSIIRDCSLFGHGIFLRMLVHDLQDPLVLGGIFEATECHSQPSSASLPGPLNSTTNMVSLQVHGFTAFGTKGRQLC